MQSCIQKHERFDCKQTSENAVQRGIKTNDSHTGKCRRLQIVLNLSQQFNVVIACNFGWKDLFIVIAVLVQIPQNSEIETQREIRCLDDFQLHDQEGRAPRCCSPSLI